jgi:hypothetical protein
MLTAVFAALFLVTLFLLMKSRSSGNLNTLPPQQSVSSIQTPPTTQPTPARFCTTCGAGMPVGAGFCGKCGSQQS